MVAAAGAGPQPIPHKNLNSTNLTEGLLFCLTPNVALAAEKISVTMAKESGVKKAVNLFHANLPSENFRCEVLPDRPATWIMKRNKKTVRLSTIAVGTLLQAGTIDRSHIKL